MRQCARTWLTVSVLALSFVLAVVGLDGAPRPAQAQSVPQVVVTPDSGAPGATVELQGSGWPAGATLFARMYRASDVDGAGADLGMTFQADAAGNFTASGMIPPTLFGGGNRGNVEVTPDAYTIVVRAGPGLSASAPFSVSAAPSGAAPDGCAVGSSP
jgi:hypothetical protein